MLIFMEIFLFAGISDMPADVSLISIKKICGKVNIVSEFLTARKGARQSR